MDVWQMMLELMSKMEGKRGDHHVLLILFGGMMSSPVSLTVPVNLFVSFPSSRETSV